LAEIPLFVQDWLKGGRDSNCELNWEKKIGVLVYRDIKLLFCDDPIKVKNIFSIKAYGVIYQKKALTSLTSVVLV